VDVLETLGLFIKSAQSPICLALEISQIENKILGYKYYFATASKANFIYSTDGDQCPGRDSVTFARCTTPFPAENRGDQPFSKQENLNKFFYYRTYHSPILTYVIHSIDGETYSAIHSLALETKGSIPLK
jgi:hypothetical protein